MRERLKKRINEESAKWKEFRAEKQKEEEERRKEAGDEPAPKDDSDDDIIIGDVKMAEPSPKKPAARKPQKGRKSVANVPIPRANPVTRLRG